MLNESLGKDKAMRCLSLFRVNLNENEPGLDSKADLNVISSFCHRNKFP